MQPSALVFLQGDVQAQKLAVAWPLACRKGISEDELFRGWSIVSGVPVILVERLGPVLRGHGICRDDGTTDPLAEQYIAAQVQASLRKPKSR